MLAQNLAVGVWRAREPDPVKTGITGVLMKRFYEKLPVPIQGLILGLLITATILLSTPPVVMFLRWWFKVWGV